MTSPIMHLEILRPFVRQRTYVVRARIHGHPRRRKRNGVMFFEVPERLRDWVPIQDDPADRHDLFLRAAVFSAMEAGRDLHVYGSVSASLLDNLESYQQIICTWWPRYRPVQIRVDRELSAEATRRDEHPQQAVLAYSGGLDSTYALYCHQSGLRRRNTYRIGACIFVHGFDIPWRDQRYVEAFGRVEPIVTELGSQLIPVRSNLKELLPPWPQSHAAGLAAALSLFSRRFAVGMVAASVRYDNPFVPESGYGSHPLSDPLLSSNDFRIIHDLGDKTRVEKSEILRHLTVARENLRVCWEGANPATNCGRCSKCVWQMLCLRAVQVHDFTAFEQDLEVERIGQLQISSRAHLEEIKACYDYAHRIGLSSHREFVELDSVIQRCEPSLASVTPSSHSKCEPVGGRTFKSNKRGLLGTRGWFKKAA